VALKDCGLVWNMEIRQHLDNRLFSPKMTENIILVYS